MGEKAFSPESSGKTAVKPTAERNARWAAAAMTALALIGEARHAEAEEKPSITLKDAKNKINEDKLQKAWENSELGGKVVFEKTVTTSRSTEKGTRWSDGHRHIVMETVTPGRPLTHAIEDGKTLEVQLADRMISSISRSMGPFGSNVASVSVERVMVSEAEVFEEPTVTIVQKNGESEEEAINNCLEYIARAYNTKLHREEADILGADQMNDTGAPTQYSDSKSSVILSHVKIVEVKIDDKSGFYTVTLEAQRAATGQEDVKEIEKVKSGPREVELGSGGGLRWIQAEAYVPGKTPRPTFGRPVKSDDPRIGTIEEKKRFMKGVKSVADYLKEHGMEPDKGSE